MTKFLFMRHGEADYSHLERWKAPGWGADLAPLTARGIEQVSRRIPQIRDWKPEFVLTSPMTRALSSAFIVIRELGLPYAVEFDLHEWVPHREFSWRTLDEVLNLQREFYAAGGEHPPGESRAWESNLEIRSRVRNVLRRYAQHARILVVSHGMQIEALTGVRDPDFAELVPLTLGAESVKTAGPPNTSFRPSLPSDAGVIKAFIAEHWGEERIVSRGEVHDASALPAFLALAGEKLCGLLTYRISGAECEIVTLDAVSQGKGIGTMLVQMAVAEAQRAGCRRVWLITTNDNLGALRFYQRRGFKIQALHRGALTLSRKLKPSIPLVGNHGIPIADEIELELRLDPSDFGRSGCPAA